MIAQATFILACSPALVLLVLWGVHDALLPYVAEHEEWVRNTDLIEHVSSSMTKQAMTAGDAMTTKQEALDHLLEIGELLRSKLCAMAGNNTKLWRYVEEWDQSRKEYEEAE